MAVEQIFQLIPNIPTIPMNITVPRLLIPGQQVQVFDPNEPPTEWVAFTVIQVNDERVELLSPRKEQTWAESSEVVVIQR